MKKKKNFIGENPPDEMRKKKEKSMRESRRRCIMYVVWCNPGQEKNNITQKKKNIRDSKQRILYNTTIHQKQRHKNEKN